MILCTHYGLLIYEWTLVPEQSKKKEKEKKVEEEETKEDVAEIDSEENVMKV